MRTALHRILKYTPVAVLGLLVLAWLGGLLGRLSIAYSQSPGPALSFESSFGTLGFSHYSSSDPLNGLGKNGVHWRAFKKWPEADQYVGTFNTRQHAVCSGGFVTALRIPVPVVATICLPLALGSLLSFRFRLWHYLTYTALVAVEFAYYLRWQ